MIPDQDLVLLRAVGDRVPNYNVGFMPRVNADAYVARRPNMQFAIEQRFSCRCCGTWAEPNLRCLKHQGRNPCAIEGCQRTTSAPRGRLADDGWMCAEHWRRHVPPHSTVRRA
jgi:hypothetical protein